MTGLEKMQNQILEEARKKAEEILEQAKQEAEQIKKDARVKGQEESTRILEKSRAEVKNTEERSVSSCALQKRQVLLETKQELIAQVLEKAYHTLTEAEEETYSRSSGRCLESMRPLRREKSAFPKKIWRGCLRVLKKRFRRSRRE